MKNKQKINDLNHRFLVSTSNVASETPFFQKLLSILVSFHCVVCSAKMHGGRQTDSSAFSFEMSKADLTADCFSDWQIHQQSHNWTPRPPRVTHFPLKPRTGPNHTVSHNSRMVRNKRLITIVSKDNVWSINMCSLETEEESSDDTAASHLQTSTCPENTCWSCFSNIPHKPQSLVNYYWLEDV